jgi:hypothetical protein
LLIVVLNGLCVGLWSGTNKILDKVTRPVVPPKKQKPWHQRQADKPFTNSYKYPKFTHDFVLGYFSAEEWRQTYDVNVMMGNRGPESEGARNRVSVCVGELLAHGMLVSRGNEKYPQHREYRRIEQATEQNHE